MPPPLQLLQSALPPSSESSSGSGSSWLLTYPTLGIDSSLDVIRAGRRMARRFIPAPTWMEGKAGIVADRRANEAELLASVSSKTAGELELSVLGTSLDCGCWYDVLVRSDMLASSRELSRLWLGPLPLPWL